MNRYLELFLNLKNKYLHIDWCEKVDIGEEKVDIGEEKVDIGEEKVDIGEEKVDIDKLTNDLTKINSYISVLTLLIHLGYLVYERKSQSCYIPHYEVEKEIRKVIKQLE